MVSGRLWKFNIYRWFSINHVLSGFSHLIIKIPYFENLAHLKVKYDKFIDFFLSTRAPLELSARQYIYAKTIVNTLCFQQ